MTSTESERNLYSIQFVANVTGINPHTIRAWEKRYGATMPVRDKNGRRMYSDNEIQRLDLLNKLVEIGSSISDIANMEKVQLVSVLEKYNHKTNLTNKSKINRKRDVDFDWEESLQQMYSSIKLKKIDQLIIEFRKCEDSMNSIEFLNKIFSPILNTLYHFSKNEIEDQQFFDTLCLALKSKLIRMLILVSSGAGVDRSVLISSGTGILNELGALASAVIFSAKGFCVDFVGINSDLNSLLLLTETLNPEIIYLSLGHNHEMSAEHKREILSSLEVNITKPDIFIGEINEAGVYNGFDVEVINHFDMLSSILESS